MLLIITHGKAVQGYAAVGSLYRWLLLADNNWKMNFVEREEDQRNRVALFDPVGLGFSGSHSMVISHSGVRFQPRGCSRMMLCCIHM